MVKRGRAERIILPEQQLPRKPGFMKTFFMVWLIACGCWLVPSSGAQAQTNERAAAALGMPGVLPQVELRGIVNVLGQQVGVLQIDRETWVVKTGDHFHAGTGRNDFQVEVLEVDLTNETVQTQIAGKVFTNSLSTAYRPAAARSWVHLQAVDFKKATEIYANLARRTVLLHPGVEMRPFSCAAAWTNAAPDKTEIAGAFTKPLSQLGIATLEDGDCFLQILPAELLPGASPGAKDLPAGAENIARGMIDFESVDMSQVINIYGKLLGRQLKGDAGYRLPIHLTTTCPLSKAQVIYAFETLFRWNGIKIILNDDNTFSVFKRCEKAIGLDQRNTH